MAPIQSVPKFLRRPKTLPNFRLEDRDRLILKFLAIIGDMSTDQIARLVGGSPRRIRDRLRLLYWHGYIARPHTQRAFRAAVHGASLIVSLSRKGARELEATGMSLNHLVDRSYRPPSASQIPHALAVVEFLVQFWKDAEAKGFHLSLHGDLLPTFPEDTRTSNRPFHLSVVVSERGKSTRLAVRADRICALELPDQTRLPFFFERDRGTETLKTKIAHKIKTYHAAFLAGRHTELFGFHRFRTLFVVPGDTRINNMIRLQERITGGHARGLFLYSTPERLSQFGVLGPAWRSAEADGISLLK